MKTKMNSIITIITVTIIIIIVIIIIIIIKDKKGEGKDYFSLFATWILHLL